MTLKRKAYERYATVNQNAMARLGDLPDNVLNIENTSDYTLTVALPEGDETLTMYESLTIGDGYGVTITAEDVASSITLDEQSFEVEGEGTATRLFKLKNTADAAATLSYQGTTMAIVSGTNTFSLTNGTASLDVAAGKVVDINDNLTVAGVSSINQDVQTTASPAFVAINAGAGSQAAPSHTFTGQTDMGLYKSSSSELGVATAGTMRYKVSASGLLMAAGHGISAADVKIYEPGTVGAATVTAVHYGDGRDITTVLTLANTVLVSLTGIGAEATGALVYTFPAGVHFHSVTSHSVAFQGGAAIVADTPELGIGSTLASGANATLGAAGATTENYTEGTAVADCSGTALVRGPLGATAGIHTGISLNAAGDAKTVYLNAADTWAGAGTLTASGTIVLKWTRM